MMRRGSSLVVLASVLASVPACGGGPTVAGDDDGEEDTRSFSEVDIDFGGSSSVGEMVVNVYADEAMSSNLVEWGVAGALGDVQWHAGGALDLADLTPDTPVTLVVGDVRPGPRVGHVMTTRQQATGGVDDLDQASSGTITLVFDASRPSVTGVVDVVPEMLSATFAGRFNLICHARDGDDVSTDRGFSSDFCSQFAHWKPVFE